MKDLGVDESVILKYMDRMASTEFILLRIEESDMLLVKEVLHLQAEDFALLG